MHMRGIWFTLSWGYRYIKYAATQQSENIQKKRDNCEPTCIQQYDNNNMLGTPYTRLSGWRLQKCAWPLCLAPVRLSSLTTLAQKGHLLLQLLGP